MRCCYEEGAAAVILLLLYLPKEPLITRRRLLLQEFTGKILLWHLGGELSRSAVSAGRSPGLRHSLGRNATRNSLEREKSCEGDRANTSATTSIITHLRSRRDIGLSRSWATADVRPVLLWMQTHLFGKLYGC